MEQRIIYHIDCNAFFASVEECFSPELKRVPMAVCGDPQSRHGIILAKNELAKAYGVKTAETIWQARKKCPGLTLVPPRHGEYSEYCEKINAIYEQYTAKVERFGIDESFLDVTGSLHLFGGDELKLANEIRERVARETGVTVSVGISFNKIFAKLASDMKKPNAVTYVSRENYREIVWPLPVADLLMVGRATEKSLRSLRINTIGELAAASRRMLRAKLGKLGEALSVYANGEDESPVAWTGEREKPKSIGHGYTFRRDIVSHEDIVTAVIALSDRVACRIRRNGMKCAAVQVTIKDAGLKVITRQRKLQCASNLEADIAREAVEIIDACWRIGAPIRMITVTGQKLEDEATPTNQLSFFGGREIDLRRERLERAVDCVRERYGRDKIVYGCVMGNDLGV